MISSNLSLKQKWQHESYSAMGTCVCVFNINKHSFQFCTNEHKAARLRIFAQTSIWSKWSQPQHLFSNKSLKQTHRPAANVLHLYSNMHCWSIILSFMHLNFGNGGVIIVAVSHHSICAICCYATRQLSAASVSQTIYSLMLCSIFLYCLVPFWCWVRGYFIGLKANENVLLPSLFAFPNSFSPEGCTFLSK